MASKKLPLEACWGVLCWHLLAITTSNPGDPVQASLFDRFWLDFTIDLGSIFDRFPIDFRSISGRFQVDFRSISCPFLGLLTGRGGMREALVNKKPTGNRFFMRGRPNFWPRIENRLWVVLALNKA